MTGKSKRNNINEWKSYRQIHAYAEDDYHKVCTSLPLIRVLGVLGILYCEIENLEKKKKNKHPRGCVRMRYIYRFVNMFLGVNSV